MRRYKDSYYRENNSEFIEKDSMNKSYLLRKLREIERSSRFYICFRNTLGENRILEAYVEKLRIDYERDVEETRNALCYLMLLRHCY